jgi:Tol biopolymer transport system component
MDSLEAHPIEGTEGAAAFPFWSPDSRWIAFESGGKLKKIDTEGGPAQVLCDVGPLFTGGFWTQDGRIVFSDLTRPPGLWELPAAGGASFPLPGLKDAGKQLSIFPALLPDGRHFIFQTGSPMSSDVYVGSLEDNSSKSFKKLLTGVAYGVVVVPSPDDSNLGYLLAIRPTSVTAGGGTLLAQPFSLSELDLAGEPVQLEQGVRVTNLSNSRTGTLLYGSANPGPTTGQITLFSREGKILRTVGESGIYNTVELSPDGKRAVMARPNVQSANQNLWIMDLVRGISTRFTFDAGVDLFPIWSPDGNRIAFSTDHRTGEPIDLYQKLSNGGSEAELLFKSNSNAIAESWSGDGRFLLFDEGSQEAPNVLVLPLDENAHVARKPFLFVQKGVGIAARFSPGPHGHPLWVAYSSNESGRYEVYVRPFDPNSPTGTPPGGGKWQVSTEGGMSPRWNGDGKELFYMTPDGTVMSVEVSGTNGVFQSGTPKPLFKPKGLVQDSASYVNWDASSDGKKFIFPVAQSANAPASPTKFIVVLNWTSLLKQ